MKSLLKKNKIIVGLGGLFLLLFLIFYFVKEKSIEIIDKVNELPRSSVFQYGTRTLDKITQIVVHHSASIGQTAADYARYHVNSKKWAGLGYHFVIEIDGSIIMGNYLTTVSYNTGGQNTKTIGICLSGDFTKQEPTAAQLKSLNNLIGHLRNELPQHLGVFGHKDYGQTSCLGPSLYKHLKQYQIA